MDRVIALWRYPLKSARGESLISVPVDVDGVRDDRTWACIDVLDATVASAKHPHRWGRLLDVETRLPDDENQRTLRIHLNGEWLIAGTTKADRALSDHLQRPVRLSQEVPGGATLHRLLPDESGMVPDWMSDTLPGHETVTPILGAHEGGRFLDFGAVHLVTTGALSALAQQTGRKDIPATRFRPNVVLDAAGDPEPGQELRFGDTVLRVISATPRCIVPGLGHGDLPADLALLTALATHHRVVLPRLGRAACFGTYATVIRPGHLEVGQRVE